MTGEIRIGHVSKTFADGTKALEDVSLTIAPGSFVTLLGPSGCGKSTLLRLIAGLSEPNKGQIQGPAQSPARTHGDIAFVFQDATLLPWSSIEKNVALPFTLSGQPAENVPGRVRAMLARVGLGEFARAYPRQLSGGMKMRASLARALITQPSLLLMDEPFGALDEITREDLGDALLDLWTESRMTTVFVTHSVNEAVYLSERVIVMSPRPGRIAADIPIEAPFPRGHEYRESTQFMKNLRQVHAALRDARQAEAL